MNKLQKDEAPKIITISDLLKIDNLKIPDYQRPYKWTSKNVNQLIDDVLLNTDKSAYRLGTIVIHKDDEGIYNIVDGQQRTTTIFLIALAIFNLLSEKNNLDSHKYLNKNEKIEDFKPKSDLVFSSDISKYNIYTNYKTIERRINEFSEDFINFFIHKCELVCVIISDISEAFQFFDSQNARGKDLDPQDLLKAYHLREMNNYVDENKKKEIVNTWEAINPSDLSDLFGNYLFRIRNWKDDKPARYFTKADVDVFKGIGPNFMDNFPYSQIYRIANYYTNEFNESYHSSIMGKKINYPHQIDQVIINGTRFFEMISYYEELKESIQVKYKDEKVFKVIDSPEYTGRYRTGDRYVYNLFICGLMYYIDRFGEYEISKAIKKIFIWAYTLRLKLYSVGLDSIDNYALGKNHSRFNLFKKIQKAITPKVILNMNLEILKEGEITNSSKIIPIKNLFKEFNYLC